MCSSAKKLGHSYLSKGPSQGWWSCAAVFALSLWRHWLGGPWIVVLCYFPLVHWAESSVAFHSPEPTENSLCSAAAWIPCLGLLARQWKSFHLLLRSLGWNYGLVPHYAARECMIRAVCASLCSFVLALAQLVTWQESGQIRILLG